MNKENSRNIFMVKKNANINCGKKIEKMEAKRKYNLRS
jgi:hypothetical protein